MKHQRALGLCRQVIAEIMACCANMQRVIGVVFGGDSAGHVPVIDKGREGFQRDTGLPGSAAPEFFSGEMGVGCCQARMSHPDLGRGKARSLARLQGRSEQGPLHPVIAPVIAGQGGRQIPPFNAVIRVRAMILRKGKRAPAFRHGECAGRCAKPREALRRSVDRCQHRHQHQHKGRCGKVGNGASGVWAIFHGKTPSATGWDHCATAGRRAEVQQPAPQARPKPQGVPSRQGTAAGANATRTPAH